MSDGYTKCTQSALSCKKKRAPQHPRFSLSSVDIRTAMPAAVGVPALSYSIGFSLFVSCKRSDRYLIFLVRQVSTSRAMKLIVIVFIRLFIDDVVRHIITPPINIFCGKLYFAKIHRQYIKIYNNYKKYQLIICKHFSACWCKKYSVYLYKQKMYRAERIIFTKLIKLRI